MTAVGGSLAYRAATGHCPAYETMGVQGNGKIAGTHPLNRHIHVEHSTIIQRSPEELYREWRDLTKLPRIMRHLESVTVIDDKRSRWVARAPNGTVEWDAIITEDRPNEKIAWESVPRSEVPNSGWVRFDKSPSNRGTVVRVNMEYQPPLGVVGAAVAYMFGEEPHQQIKEDLHLFKSRMETGEVATNHGQPRGRCGA